MEVFMIKKISILLVFLMVAGAAFSNVKISGKHKDKMKDGKKVNCGYCHTGEMKIEKKKGQVQGQKLNGVAFSKIKSCAGSDCHK
jgi:nitrate/TMAO reductase-like tetraheme cytochrome c subunit